MEKFKTQYQHWILKTDEDNILWILINRADSHVNTLNEAVLREFAEILENIRNQPLKGIVIGSAKNTGFIAGADVSQFATLTSEQEAIHLISQGQEIFTQLEQLSVPTLAMIEGFCFGGGLELALACRYRIAESSAKTRLGLPEVKLGIHPGWGGSVRLPKLIGVFRAMDVILSGRSLSAQAARKMGIVDEVVPKRLLEKAAKDILLSAPTRGRQWYALFEIPFIRPFLAKLFTARLSKKISAKHYPAPFKVIENWQEWGTGPRAMQQEAQSIGSLLVSETARNLVRVFFLQEKLKNLGKKSEFAPKHVHVIGAGVMGGDIAAWCALKGFQVTLQDRTPKLIGGAIKRAYGLANKQLKEKNLIKAMMDRLVPDPHGMGIARADIIIEAIFENLQAKQELFAEVEKLAKIDAIIASNTSTIPLEEMSANLTNPERLVGIHFFNPVAKMQLVEVVHSPQTNKEVIERAMTFVKKIDRLPLPVKSSPGFLVNRILIPYMLEAFVILEEGVPGPVIDQAAVNFGMPMGPIELADAVGLDICLAALQRIEPNQETAVFKRLKEYIAKGKLGRKTKEGFYRYQNDHAIKAKLNPTEPIPTDITNRLVLRLLNEAVGCLQEEIVENADLLDAGCIFGFGFPPFRGGPSVYIKSLGEEELLKLLQEFESRYGSRFAANKGWQLGVA